ncbi:polysaccharide pyruvyl transferase family protein [Brevibacterium sp. S111]|uniref:polysaccharide pyruvyl transferase family protein n=1 Tax=Brevibacterium sp. S111 TaxID=2483795 RepID=UPI00108090A6|nr:polysaccharide pyruvyl transferase family protein [Brevibacterium sp. S111]TGD08486.1 polysaccharide pyruvyl transferase family protein [Brevibacterium sp. S111]
MKAVVLGDIGWKELYHLGDEAMTEVAVSELQERGFEPTLVAGDPDVSAKMYDVPAVGRVGFWSKEDRSQHKKRLGRLGKVLDGPEGDYTDIVKAVRSADLTIIAGGGNLNDQLPSHVYERLAFKRIAEKFSKPLVVSSQTVGPNLSGEMRDAVIEIADYARVFGCRDASSVGLVRSLVKDRHRVYRQVDDAAVLVPTSDESREARELLADYTDDGPFAVAAFTSHVGTSDFSKTEYVHALADICRQVSERCGVNVLLTPHVGSFTRGNERDDQVVHANIEKLAQGPKSRVYSLPTLKAGVAVALTRMASLSFSTRYHPAVFALAAGVPHVGLIQSYYSSVKVRGALSNYGLSCYGVPFISKADMVSAIVSCFERSRTVSNMAKAGQEYHANFQEKWWDFICSNVERGADSSYLPAFSCQQEYAISEEWSVRVEGQLPLFESLSVARR